MCGDVLAGSRATCDSSAARPIAVDRLRGDDPFDLVERVEHRALHRDHRVAAVPARRHGPAAREQCRAPSAVASRRAETRDLALAHDDAQRRIGALQRVRGPEPGVAGTPTITTSAIESPAKRRPRHALLGRKRGVPQAATVCHVHRRKYAPRMIRSETREHVAIVTIDNPPGERTPGRRLVPLADALRAAGRDPDVAGA